MSNIQVLAGANVGNVRAVFSGRCRGFAAPLELVRVHLRAVVRSGVRRRLAADFGGYLVTEAGPDVLPLFSGRRWMHRARLDRSAVSGCWELLRSQAGGPLDAPDWLPAGACMNLVPFIAAGECAQKLSARWSESLRGAVGCDADQVWREVGGRVVVLGRVRTGRAAAGDDEVLREEFAGELAGAAIDAPDCCLSGSLVEYVTGGGKRCAVVGRFCRRGVFQ